MKKIILSLLITIAVAFIIVIGIKPDLLERIGSTRITSSKPPIILVHGFNQSSDFWNKINLISELEETGTIYMGNFHSKDKSSKSKIQLITKNDIKEGQSAVYTLSLPEKGTKDIRDSGILLEKVIQEVTDRHRCEKVRLIAFSAGGVVCREYLTNHLKEHHVASLTTISTPHMGSEHAWLSVNYHNLKSTLKSLELNNNGNLLSKGTNYATSFAIDQFTSRLEQWGNDAGIDINSQCAFMLAEPEHGNYLDNLSKSPHPTDVHYSCIITEESILNYNWQKLKSDFSTIKSGNFTNTSIADNLLDLARNGLGRLDKISSQFSSLKFRGDGVVSKFSQNINNTESFKNNTSIHASIIQLESDHGGASMKSAIMKSLYQ